MDLQRDVRAVGQRLVDVVDSVGEDIAQLDDLASHLRVAPQQVDAVGQRGAKSYSKRPLCCRRRPTAHQQQLGGRSAGSAELLVSDLEKLDAGTV